MSENKMPEELLAVLKKRDDEFGFSLPYHNGFIRCFELMTEKLDWHRAKSQQLESTIDELAEALRSMQDKYHASNSEVEKLRAQLDIARKYLEDIQSSSKKDRVLKAFIYMPDSFKSEHAKQGLQELEEADK